MKIQDNNISLKLSASSLPKKKDSKVNEEIVTYQGKVDYEKNVINKPTLNGKELVGDVIEEDPSMVAIELSELSNLFNSIFN